MKAFGLAILAAFTGLGSATFAASFDTVQLGQIQLDASNSLARFRQLITPENHALLGFGTTSEIMTATNGLPLPIYTMAWSRLTNYNPGSELALLLEPQPQTDTPPRVIVPVIAGTNARSAIFLREVVLPGGAGRHWTNMSWGKPNLIRDLIRTYDAVPHAELRADTLPFIVEIPVFDIWLVGYFNHQEKVVFRSTTRMRLGAIIVDPNEVISQAAMDYLRVTAQRYNGLPN